MQRLLRKKIQQQYMSDKESDPEIYYVPNIYNHYDYDEDIVVLDENLKDYPLAHEEIKQHEIKHSKSSSVWYNLKLEFATDMRKLFATDETMQEVEEYMEDIQHDLYTIIKFEFIKLMRLFWMLILLPIAEIYKFFRKLF